MNKIVVKYLIFLTLSFFCLPTLRSQTYKADQIIGYWMSPKKDLIVQCYKFNNLYYGKVVWFYKYYSNEPFNQNGMPEEKWVNTIVMNKFSFLDNEWTGGEIYDLKSGKTYSAYISMYNSNSIKVTGYILFRFLSQSVIFTRYREPKLPAFN